MSASDPKQTLSISRCCQTRSQPKLSGGSNFALYPTSTLAYGPTRLAPFSLTQRGHPHWQTKNIPGRCDEQTHCVRNLRYCPSDASFCGEGANWCPRRSLRNLKGRIYLCLSDDRRIQS